MALMEIAVIPVGSKTTSISDYVAEAIKILDEEEAKYEVTSMGTVVEGDLRELFLLAEKMHEAVIKKGAARVVTNIKIDDRRDKPITIETKLKATQRKLH